MRRLLLLILVVLLVVPVVVAVPPVKTVVQQSVGLTIASDLLEGVKQNVSREWHVHVSNTSTIFSSGVTCNLHIYFNGDPSEQVHIDTTSVFNGYDMEFPVNASVHALKGEYNYKAFCNTSSQVGLFEEEYYVTGNGDFPADGLFQAFIWLLFIFAVMSSLYIFILTITKLITASETVYGLMNAWGSYLLLLIAYFLGSGYLLTSYVEDIIGFMLIPLGIANCFLPLVSLFITMFVKGTQKKKNLSPAELGGFPRNG